MLDQLVESRDSVAGENSRRGGLLLATAVLMVSGLLFAWGYSLFAKDAYGFGSGELELSTLVAPVPVAEEEPPPPAPEQPKEKAAPNVDTRTIIIQTMDDSPKVPDKPSVVPNTVKPPRPGIATREGLTNNDADNAAKSTYKGAGNTEGSGLTGGEGESKTGGNEGGNVTPKPPPPPPPPPPTKPPVPKRISGGVLNGKATSLPKPPYPAAARAVRASGAVNVQVTISESGSVVSANAVSGHPLLRQAAEQAARSARFAPTLLSGQPVSVTGVIVYNFVP